MSTFAVVCTYFVLLAMPFCIDAWCSPNETWDCDLIIRGGKRSGDDNFRSVRFFNEKHKSIAAIKVQPSAFDMSFELLRKSSDTSTESILAAQMTSEKFELFPGRHKFDGTSFIVNGKSSFRDNLAANSLAILDASTSTSPTTGSVTATGGVGIKDNLHVGSTIKIHGGTESTDLGTGAVVINGGLSVAKSAHVNRLNVHAAANLRGSLTVSEGAVKIVGKKGIGESPALTIDGTVSVLGTSEFNKMLRVQSKQGLSGVKMLQSGGIKLFSFAKDAYIDFEAKNVESEEEDDQSKKASSKSTTDTLRAMQMGDENSLLIHNGNVVVDRKGYVGVGVVQPTHILHVNGQVRSSMSTIATASDRRLKKNIKPVNISESLERIEKLRVTEFEWKNKSVGRRPTSRQRGFIAQEVEKVMPDAVQIVPGGDDNPKIKDLRLLNFDPIIIDLVGAVQALQSQLKEEREHRRELERSLAAFVKK